jgi:hypothetical protein
LEFVCTLIGSIVESETLMDQERAD